MVLGRVDVRVKRRRRVDCMVAVVGAKVRVRLLGCELEVEMERKEFLGG